MNTPVKFEIAKLLKEKGFDRVYSNSNFYTEGYPDNYPLNLFITKNDYTKEQYKMHYVAPTIAEVVMWLYDKYGIWIGVQPTSIVEKFQFRTYWNNKGVMNQHWNNSMSKEFNSPTEAYETAIEYTLNKLI